MEDQVQQVLAKIDKSHHLYGGSTVKYWQECPGWASLISQLPKEKAGPAADKGTALHTGVLEVKTQSEITLLQTGKKLPIVYDNIPNWPEDGAEIADAFWKEVWVKVLEEFITNKTIYIEKKLMYSEELDSGGTADFIALYYNDKAQLVGVVGDLKTGYHEVGADDPQLLFYCACLMDIAEKKGKKIDVFKTFIYQPTHSPAYKEHSYKRTQVERAHKKYAKAIAESRKPNPKFKAGDHCKFCKGIGNCKAYNKHMGDKMDLAVQGDALQQVEVLADDVLRNIFVYSDQIEAYISSVRKEIIRRFAQGKTIEGLKLVEGVSKRRWKDNEEEIVKVLKEYNIQPTAEKLVGIGAVEKMLKNTGQSKEEIFLTMNSLTEKPKAHPKITTLDAPGEPLKLDSGIDAFLALDNVDSE